MQEEFRDIPNFKGYQISDLANVKSLTNGIILKKTRYKGRDQISIGRKRSLGGRKAFRVSVLVAIAFLGHKPCGYKLIVDHIDNNPLNDNLSNIQLITARENTSKDRKGKNKYTGVSFGKIEKKWRSQIWIKNKLIHIGSFNTSKEASSAYNNAVLDHEAGREVKTYKNIKSSKYVGVTWHKQHQKWYAQKRINGKNKFLGLFLSEEDAYNATL